MPQLRCSALFIRLFLQRFGNYVAIKKKTWLISLVAIKMERLKMKIFKIPGRGKIFVTKKAKSHKDSQGKTTFKKPQKG
jgi:hypothetical protein